MLLKQNSTKTKSSFGAGIGVGVLVSIVLGLALSMLLAVAVTKEQVEEQAIEYITPVVVLVASMVGCTVAGKREKEKLAIVIGITGAIYMLVLIGTGILFFDGGFYNLWTSLLSIIFACAGSCAICIRGKGSGRKRKRTYR